MRLVRFLNDDRFGLWKAGELAHDLGQESPAVPLRVLRLLTTGELITLTNPYERNLIERVEEP